MSILSFIKKISVQPAIYWGAPESDGEGGFTFDEPTQIYVRWDDEVKVRRDNNGTIFTCQAVVLVNEDLEIGGWLKLGEVTDLDSELENNPKNYSDAYLIGRVSKVPLLKSKTKFVRTVYLGYSEQGN